MESRRIQLVGNRSYSVSLPKNWVIQNNLKEKNNVFIETTKNNDLLIHATSNENPNNSSLQVNIRNINNIAEFIVFSYVKNLNSLIINAEKFSYKTIKTIRFVLKHLEGYDIIYEDEKKIEISFLFNEINTNIPKILQRMKYLLKLEIESFENNDVETLDETENTIDRLYHLAERILFSCIRDSNLRKENNIHFDEDIFFYRSIVKKVENIGDNIYKFKFSKMDSIDKKIIERHIKFLDLAITDNCEISTLKENLLKIKPNTKTCNEKPILRRIHHLCQDVIENSISLELNKIYFSK